MRTRRTRKYAGGSVEKVHAPNNLGAAGCQEFVWVQVVDGYEIALQSGFCPPATPFVVQAHSAAQEPLPEEDSEWSVDTIPNDRQR